MAQGQCPYCESGPGEQHRDNCITRQGGLAWTINPKGGDKRFEYVGGGIQIELKTP